MKIRYAASLRDHLGLHIARGLVDAFTGHPICEEEDDNYLSGQAVILAQDNTPLHAWPYDSPAYQEQDIGEIDTLILHTGVDSAPLRGIFGADLTHPLHIYVHLLHTLPLNDTPLRIEEQSHIAGAKWFMTQLPDVLNYLDDYSPWSSQWLDGFQDAFWNRQNHMHRNFNTLPQDPGRFLNVNYDSWWSWMGYPLKEGETSLGLKERLNTIRTEPHDC